MVEHVETALSMQSTYLVYFKYVDCYGENCEELYKIVQLGKLYVNL